MSDLHVRLAVMSDAEFIVRTHHDSVWNTARHHYPPEILETWAVKLTDDNYEQVRQEIADPAMVVLVAESHGHVAGFGMIVPADEELRAVYVDPVFGRQGVGTAILNRLEETARQRGVARLNVACHSTRKRSTESTATRCLSEPSIAFDRAMKWRASG